MRGRCAGVSAYLTHCAFGLARNHSSYQFTRVTGVMSNCSCLMSVAATEMEGAGGGVAAAMDANETAAKSRTQLFIRLPVVDRPGRQTIRASQRTVSAYAGWRR